MFRKPAGLLQTPVPAQRFKSIAMDLWSLTRNDRRGRGSRVVGHRIVAGFNEFEPSTTKDLPCRQRCTPIVSRWTSSRWCGVVVRRGGASSGVVHATGPWFKITWSVAKSLLASLISDVNLSSPPPARVESLSVPVFFVCFRFSLVSMKYRCGQTYSQSWLLVACSQKPSSLAAQAAARRN
ncbi:hypothetical protein TNCV_2575061 [Trichonephila clavipes]|nr:hypothetical protein TNCV_2575061 [Trichonephila clavipes]